MNVRSILESVGRSLVLCGLAGLLWIGAPKSVSASPIFTVSLVSATATAQTGLQTLVTASLNVSGSVSGTFSTAGFSTVLSWTTSSPGVSGTNLYTVTSAGTPLTQGSGALIVSGSNFLYSAADPFPTMNTFNLDSDYERYVSIIADNVDLSGSFSNVTIMQIRFAVSPDIKNAVFGFLLDGNAPDYGFVEGSTFDNVTFTSGGGSIVIVPEPDTILACLLGIVVLGAWMTRWSRQHRDRSAPMATAA